MKKNFFLGENYILEWIPLKIRYIDTDVINFKDLTEMYSLEFKDDIYLLGTLDKIFMLNELKKQFKNLTRYMNAGILLMNLKSMRKYRIDLASIKRINQ